MEVAGAMAALLEEAVPQEAAAAMALEAAVAVALEAAAPLEAALDVAEALTAALRWLRRPSEGGGSARGSGGGAGGSGGGAGGSGGARGEGGGGADGDDSAGATLACWRDAGASWSATGLQVQVRVGQRSVGSVAPSGGRTIGTSVRGQDPPQPAAGEAKFHT